MPRIACIHHIEIEKQVSLRLLGYFIYDCYWIENLYTGITYFVFAKSRDQPVNQICHSHTYIFQFPIRQRRRSDRTIDFHLFYFLPRFRYHVLSQSDRGLSRRLELCDSAVGKRNLLVRLRMEDWIAHARFLDVFRVILRTLQLFE